MKTETIRLRCTTEERARWKKAAAENGYTSLSAWMRDWANGEAAIDEAREETVKPRIHEAHNQRTFRPMPKSDSMR